MGKHGYLSLNDIGYGEATGFKGVNCRHDWRPYYEGSSKTYTDRELKEMADKTVTYNGKEIPYYEATQMQSKMERQIRQYKKEISALQGSLLSNNKDLDVNKIEQKDLYNDNLSVQIDGYTIVLEQVYYNKRDNKGYCRFSVRQKGLDMREVYIKEQPNNFQGFVLSKNSITKKDARFFFFVDADMKMGTIGEDGGFQQKKDVMYVYYMFELEGEGIKKVDYIYLYDKDAGKDGYTEFDSTPKCAAAKFKIK